MHWAGQGDCVSPGVSVPADPQEWGGGWVLKAGPFAAGTAGGLFLLPKEGSGVCQERTPTSQPMQQAAARGASLPQGDQLPALLSALHQIKQDKNHH